MRRLIVGLLAIGLLAGLGGALLSKTRRPAPPVATFADGSRIEYLGSAVGSATFSTERPWEKTLRRFLPPRWLGFLPPASSGSCSAGTNSVTFYFRRSGSNAVSAWAHYAARDSHGFLYPPEGGSCSFGSGATRILGLTLTAYPRRQAAFDFEFLDAQGGMLASMHLPNPIRAPFPSWMPRPLPITLTLESLRMHTNTIWLWLQPNWRVQSGDPQWQHAHAGYAMVSDATGNNGTFSSFQESAWRLATHVHRSNWEDFQPAEKLVLTNLIVPAPGQFVRLNASARITGVELAVEALCGAGTFSITNNPTNGVTRGMEPGPGGSGHGSSSYGDGVVEEHWRSAQPFLFVEVKGMQEADELRFRAFDEQAQEIKLEASGYQGRPGGSQARVYTPAFRTLTNGVITRLEIVVSRPLDFECFIDPAEVELGR